MESRTWKWLDKIGPPVPMWVLLLMAFLMLTPWWAAVAVAIVLVGLAIGSACSRPRRP